MESMQTNDHDLLIAINIGQQDLRTDIRSISDTLTDLKKSIEITNQRQTDLEQRTTNISNSVQRLYADFNDTNRVVIQLKTDTDKWKLYVKALVIFSTPVYFVILAVVTKVAIQYFVP